jgi:hypothetical protein
MPQSCDQEDVRPAPETTKEDVMRLIILAVVGATLTMGILGTAASQEASLPAFIADEDASRSDYGTCPAPETICYLFHGNTAQPTNYCLYDDCFEMTFFERARVVASDDEGLFPRSFKAWHGDMALYTVWSVFPCEMERSGSKTKIRIPAGSAICGAGLMTPDAIYYWHFVSNPVTGCLGMGECKQTIVYEPAADPMTD